MLIFRPSKSGISIICLMALFAASWLPPMAMAQNERPPTEQLLPETTVGYIKIANIRDMIEKISRSNMGKLLSDENIAPLAQQLYQEGVEAYDEYVKIGLSLDEIKSLPTGEMTLALIAPKRKKPVFLFLVQTDPENESVTKAIDVGRDFAEKQGATLETEELEEVTYESIVNGDDRVTYFKLDGMVIGSNSREELDDLVDRWHGREVEKTRPLAENRKFVTIMNRCRGSKKYTPDMLFYVDPIELARSAFRGEVQAQFVINFLPLLGLDGILAVGGSSTMFVDEFESVAQGHVLLASPRKGILEMLAFKPGNYRPEPWVPEAATTYYSTSIDLRKMMVELEKVVDLIAGEGEFRKRLENDVNKEIGFDLEADLINSLTGRATMFNWMEPPARFTSQVFTVGLELESPEKIQDVMDAILARIEEDNEDVFANLEERDYKGYHYWSVSDEAMDKLNNRQRERTSERREQRGQKDVNVEFDANVPQLCWGVIENYFFLSGSPQCMELMLDTLRGDKKSLAESEQFKTVSSKMTNLLGTDMPCFVVYQDPKEIMRAMIDAARLEHTGPLLDLADGNKYAEGIRKAMQDHPLPPFESIEQYFRPSGMFITSEDSGFHMLAFQISSEEEQKTDK